MTSTITTALQNQVYTITLARPDVMNAFNDVMAVELLRAFEEAQSLPEARVILLRGVGQAFCVGGDIHFFADISREKLAITISATIEVLNTLITTMVNSTKPIVTAVHGAVAGVGLSFVLASDLVIAAHETKFTTAYSKIGVPPDGGTTYWLPRIVGHRRAMELILLGELFTAEQAYDYGIVNWVVPHEQLTAVTDKVLDKLSMGAPVAYRLIKNLLSETSDATLEEQLNHEKHTFIECSRTEDFQTGIKSFLAKQKPKFIGK